MEKKLAELKKRIAAARAAGGRRYPSDVRAGAADAARSWLAAGGRRAELLLRLDVSGSTLDYWMARPTASSKRVVRRVAVVASGSREANSEGLVAQLGAGVLVAGLTVDDMIALARGLA